LLAVDGDAGDEVAVGQGGDGPGKGAGREDDVVVQDGDHLTAAREGQGQLVDLGVAALREGRGEEHLEVGGAAARACGP